MSMATRRDVVVRGGRLDGLRMVVEDVGQRGPVLIGGAAIFDGDDLIELSSVGGSPKQILNPDRWCYSDETAELVYREAGR